MLTRILFFILPFLAAAGKLCAQGAGNSYQRVSQLLHYTVDANAVLADSFVYQYHGDMGSIFSEEGYDYVGWGYDAALRPVYDYSSHLLAPGGILDVRYDTLRHYQVNQNGLMTWYQQWQIGWNGTAIANFDRVGYGQEYFRYRTAQEMGGNGLPARIYQLYQNASSSSWDTANVRYLRYDVQGRLAVDSIYNIRPEPWMADSQWYLKSEYNYRPDGRLERMNLWVWQNGAWMESNGLSYFYDLGGRLTQVLSGRLQGATTLQDSSYRYLYQYEGSRIRQSAYETNYGDGRWIRSSEIEFYRNSTRFVDSIRSKYIIMIGSYGEAHLRFYRNAGGLPLASTVQRVTNTVPDPAHDSVVYRYESYQSTSIPDGPKTGLVQLYPNPVRGGKLHLRWGRMPLTTDMDVQLTDMSGRLLRQVSGVVSYPVQAVELGELPAGTYVVRVRVGKEEVSAETISFN